MDIINPPKANFSGPKPPPVPGTPKQAPPRPIPVVKPAASAAKLAQPSVPPSTPSPKPLAPAKPVAPKPSLPAPTPGAKPPAPANVAIHTMKDDLTSLRTATRPMPQAPLAKPAVFTPSSTPSVPAPSLPIAPLNPIGGKSVVIPHEAPKRGLKGILTAVILLLIALLAAGSAWYFLLSPSSTQGPTAQAPKSIQEMLPANATAITEYQLNDATRPKIQQLFSQQSAKQPTFDTLLAGDPRLAIPYADVTQIYYIQLSNDPRPYLLSPETSSWATLFENTSASQTTTQHGWRMAHPVNVANFTAALSQGTMAAQAKSPLSTFTSGYGVRVYLATDTLASAIAQGAGISTSALGSQSLNIKSDVSITGGNLILFDGLATTAPTQATILKADPVLMGIVPADAQFVYAGNDLGNDIQEWSLQPSLLAPEIISQPQVKQMLTGFNALPYVFYRQGSALDTTPRFGLIVKLTPDLVKSLTNEKVGLETALFALRPLITGTTAPLPTLPLFADGAYSEIPLRYVNINGPTQAIDYAISDPYLVIATSKDSMFATLDALTKKAKGLLEQHTGLQPAKDAIQTNSTAHSIMIIPVQESSILTQALPGFVAAQNAIITVFVAPLDGATQSISGFLAF